ncbi:hypothetical protein ACS0TY_002978 [Phlomoides rotata]
MRNMSYLCEVSDEDCRDQLRMDPHHTKNRCVKFSFKWSGQTVSKHFHTVLNSVLGLHAMFLIKPQPITEDDIDPRWQSFQGFLGALDGTYIDVHVPITEKGRYRNRKGQVSVNVLGVCDKNMRFVYVLTGWEGSAADSRVLRNAINRENGLKVPIGTRSFLRGVYKFDNGLCWQTCGTRWREDEDCSWAFEEDALIMCLTNVVIEGWKSDNGFKAGFLRELEKEIFGKDRATGEHVVDPIDIINELYRGGMDQDGDPIERCVPLTTDGLEKDDNFISKPTDPHLNAVSRGKKWKSVDTDISMLVESLGDFIKFSKVALTEFSSGGNKGSVSSNENMQLNEIMKGIDGLKVSDKLKVCDELVQNSKRLEFFITLPVEEQDEYVWMLLDGRL